ncbi:hypothetical protein ACSFBF_07065 [Variovorax sp. ZT5P49]|uniref:hypothetical protein n=1 Tax=Variovorax sp. ZT5P49 TaxID=3443733 RepID=UPI003F4539E1
MSATFTPVLDSIERDAERFRYIAAAPEAGIQLLHLLAQGESTITSLRFMIDLLMAAKAKAMLATGVAS